LDGADFLGEERITKVTQSFTERKKQNRCEKKNKGEEGWTEPGRKKNG